MRVNIFTDGSCNTATGVGAASTVFKNGNEYTFLYADTTSNRMEMKAALQGIQDAPDRTEINLYSDSQYLVLGITEWIIKWKANNWKGSNKKFIENRDLWELLDIQNQRLNIHWHWTRRGALEGNVRADYLCTKAINRGTNLVLNTYKDKRG